MADKLSTYRRKRSADRTPEPIPAEAPPPGAGSSFVIQEHHARALHWDFRLERDGVLVSWAVPKGLPMDPKSNRLAVQTEDHPLEYAGFAGDIPHGEYGGGKVVIWDEGEYECEKWSEREVMVVLHGSRVQGRYVLIRTGGKQWLMHRMDPAPTGRVRLPTDVKPMRPSRGALPPSTEDDEYAYEVLLRGARAIAYVDGGRVRLTSNDRDITTAFPELQALGASLGALAAVFDGDIVVAKPDGGRPSPSGLKSRLAATNRNQVRRLAGEVPALYHVADLLHLDGHDTTGLPLRQRRELVDSLELAGPNWTTSRVQVGGGAELLAAAREEKLPGVLAKRLDSVYEPGRRSTAWIKVTDADG